MANESRAFYAACCESPSPRQIRPMGCGVSTLASKPPKSGELVADVCIASKAPSLPSAVQLHYLQQRHSIQL